MWDDEPSKEWSIEWFLCHHSVATRDKIVFMDRYSFILRFNH
jgi:hypothetical protein